MSPKKDRAPAGYFPYVVAPLTGIWDLPAGTDPDAPLDKNKLIWKIMIRQPDFVREDLVQMLVKELQNKEENPALSLVRLEKMEEGLCCQMMHIGPFDTEAETFGIMEEWLKQQGYRRLKKIPPGNLSQRFQKSRSGKE